MYQKKMSKAVIIPEEELVSRIDELETRIKNTSRNNQSLLALYNITLNVYKDIMANCDRIDVEESWEVSKNIKDLVKNYPKGLIILKKLKEDDNN
jgi:hypothetical protein